MSNGYDFFGSAGGPSAPPAPTGRPPQAPPVDRWGLPVGAATQATQATQAMQATQPPLTGIQPGFAAASWQQPPAKPSRNTPLVIGGVVLAAAVAAGAVFYFTRSHPISLPPSVGGVAEITSLTSSEKSDLKDAEKELGKRAHIHDISSRVYGDVASGNGYFVLAGHINGSDTSFADVENQVAAAAAGAGANFSSGVVSSGANDFECVWAAPAGHNVSVCFWWSNHSVLVGEGLGFDAQSTADAMAQAKTYAGLK